MPQAQLPIFPTGATIINERLAFERRGEQIVYINGHLPVFTHDVKDTASFRLFTTQLIANGSATQGDIVRAFGVSMTTVKRCCRLLRERGVSGFFRPPQRKRGHRLTPEVLARAQDMLDRGLGVPVIAKELGVLASTLHKAIDSGRLRRVKKKRIPTPRGRPAHQQAKANAVPATATQRLE
jgi:transposase